MHTTPKKPQRRIIPRMLIPKRNRQHLHARRLQYPRVQRDQQLRRLVEDEVVREAGGALEAGLHAELDEDTVANGADDHVREGSVHDGCGDGGGAALATS